MGPGEESGDACWSAAHPELSTKNLDLCDLQRFPMKKNVGGGAPSVPSTYERLFKDNVMQTGALAPAPLRSPSRGTLMLDTTAPQTPSMSPEGVCLSPTQNAQSSIIRHTQGLPKTPPLPDLRGGNSRQEGGEVGPL